MVWYGMLDIWFLNHIIKESKLVNKFDYNITGDTTLSREVFI
jgi:hypothetical protein